MTEMLSDTRPEARAVLTSLYRGAGREACLRIALRMSEDFRGIAESGIRSRRPGASAAEVRRELARICLGSALAERVLARRPE
jgi:hypothetical protein